MATNTRELSLYQQYKQGLLTQDEYARQLQLRNLGNISETKRTLPQETQYQTAVYNQASSDVGKYSSPTTFGQKLKEAIQTAMGQAGGTKLMEERKNLRAQLFAAPDTMYAQESGLTNLSPAEQNRIIALREGGLMGQLENLDYAINQRGQTANDLLGTGLGIYDEQRTEAQRQADMAAQRLASIQQSQSAQQQALQDYYSSLGYSINPQTGDLSRNLEGLGFDLKSGGGAVSANVTQDDVTQDDAGFLKLLAEQASSGKITDMQAFQQIEDSYKNSATRNPNLISQLKYLYQQARQELAPKIPEYTGQGLDYLGELLNVGESSKNYNAFNLNIPTEQNISSLSKDEILAGVIGSDTTDVRNQKMNDYYGGQRGIQLLPTLDSVYNYIFGN